MVAGFIDSASIQLSAKETISAALAKVKASISDTIKQATNIGPRLTAGLDVVRAKLSSVGDSVGKFGAKLQSLGTKMAIGGGLGVGLLAGAVNAAGDLGEVNNRFDALFKDQGKAARQFSADLGAAVGRSQPQLLGMLSEFQGLASGLKMDSDAAREFSQQMTSATLDLSSFANLSDEEGSQRMLSALTGSSEVLRKFGVDISAAALKARGVKDTATELEKVRARFEIIQETMARQGAIGDAEKTAGSYANTMKRLHAVISDTAASIGSALLPEITSFANLAVNAAKSASTWIQQNTGLVKIIAAVTAGVAASGIAITVLGTVISGIGATIGGLSAALGLVFSPIGLIVAGLAAAVALWMKFTVSGQAAASKIGEGLTFVRGQFSMLVELVKAGEFQTAFAVVTTSAQVVWTSFIATMKTAWIQAAGFIESVWRNLGFAIAKLFDGMVLAVQTTMNKMIAGVNKMLPKSMEFGKFDTTAARQNLKNLTDASREAQDTIAGRVASQVAAAQAPAQAAKKAWKEAQDAAANAVQRARSAAVQKAADAANPLTQNRPPEIIPQDDTPPTDPGPQIESTFKTIQNELKGISTRSDESVTAFIAAANPSRMIGDAMKASRESIAAQQKAAFDAVRQNALDAMARINVTSPDMGALGDFAPQSVTLDLAKMREQFAGDANNPASQITATMAALQSQMNSLSGSARQMGEAYRAANTIPILERQVAALDRIAAAIEQQPGLIGSEFSDALKENVGTANFYKT